MHSNSGGLRVVWHLMMGEYRWKVAAAVSVMIAAGFAEVFGIAAVLPVLVVATGSGGGGGRLNQIIGTVADWLGGQPPLEVLLAMVVFGICLKAAVGLIGQQIMVRGTSRVAADLRRDLIKGLMGARWNYMVSQPTGSIANYISNEVIRAAGAFSATVGLISAVLTAIPFALMAFAVSHQLTIGALAVSAMMMFILRRTLSKTRHHNVELLLFARSLVATLVDSVMSLKSIKAMGLQERVWPFLRRDVDRVMQAERKQNFSKGLQTALQEPMLAVVICAGLYFSLKQAQLNFAEIGFMLVLFQRLVTRVVSIQNQMQMMATAEGAYIHLLGEIEAARTAAELPAAQLRNRTPIRLTYAIHLRGVTMAYGEKPIFTDFDLTIPAGKITAIVGPSGAGKTTLVDIVTGLQWPQAGSVVIDDTALTENNLVTWRRRIGYVPQELQLLNDTVFANLTLMEANAERGKAEIALKQAGAWDFVSALPHGMDTVVGERGAAISGGQRQRIAIARALMRDPDLLILDEATTALDPVTEKVVCDRLRELAGRITIIAITHQSALTEIADVILRVENGTVKDVVRHSAAVGASL